MTILSPASQSWVPRQKSPSDDLHPRPQPAAITSVLTRARIPSQRKTTNPSERCWGAREAGNGFWYRWSRGEAETQGTGDEQGGSLPTRNDQPRSRVSHWRERGEDTCAGRPGGGAWGRGWGGKLRPELGALSSPQRLLPSPHCSALTPSLLPAAQKPPELAGALRFSKRASLPRKAQKVPLGPAKCYFQPRARRRPLGRGPPCLGPHFPQVSLPRRPETPGQEICPFTWRPSAGPAGCVTVAGPQIPAMHSHLGPGAEVTCKGPPEPQ